MGKIGVEGPQVVPAGLELKTFIKSSSSALDPKKFKSEFQFSGLESENPKSEEKKIGN